MSDPLPRNLAGRFQILTDLINPPIYNEHDEIIGYSEPIISIEEAIKLLDGPEDSDEEMKNGG